jgi:creatinine amidohydrolase
MRKISLSSLLAVLTAAALYAQPSSREMSNLNWMEFREWVPQKISTVLLPTGTIEPHGVANNGADIVAPVEIARRMAASVNALIAPVVPYGVTGSLDGYPGAFSISEPAYRAYMSDVLDGLARQGFRNLIVLNGHGGPQTAILNDLAEQTGQASYPHARGELVVVLFRRNAEDFRRRWRPCRLERKRIHSVDRSEIGAPGTLR